MVDVANRAHPVHALDHVLADVRAPALVVPRVLDQSREADPSPVALVPSPSRQLNHVHALVQSKCCHLSLWYWKQC